MTPPNALEPLDHGGDLDAARKLFPGAPEPFLDLSTGINPHPYPIPVLAPQVFARLPAPEALTRLSAVAAKAYGAPSESNVVPASGTQSLMTLLARAVAPGRALIVGPTYAEHARIASLAGHDVSIVPDLDRLADADLVIVVNPNNPDGRVFGLDDLLAIAEQQRVHGGLLIVDEAFMDVGPQGMSMAGYVERANVVVLRSFGKFFGLAGVRLSFALASRDVAARRRASLGPWPVSGPSLAIGEQALSDTAWMEKSRHTLAEAARRLDEMLSEAGFEKIGGTSLFSLVRTPDAQQVFDRLGRAGIFVRRFAEVPHWLRFGLPAAESDWQRLAAALRR